MCRRIVGRGTQVLSIQGCTSGEHANNVGLSVIHHWYWITQWEKWMEQGSCLLWCPNPTNVDKYEDEFGLQIHLLVGFLTVLQVGLKRSLNSLTTNSQVVASPKTLSILKLSFSPLSCISLLVLLFSLLVFTFFLSFFLPLAYFFSSSPYILPFEWGSNYYHFAKFHANLLSPRISRN